MSELLGFTQYELLRGTGLEHDDVQYLLDLYEGMACIMDSETGEIVYLESIH